MMSEAVVPVLMTRPELNSIGSIYPEGRFLNVIAAATLLVLRAISPPVPMYSPLQVMSVASLLVTEAKLVPEDLTGDEGTPALTENEVI